MGLPRHVAMRRLSAVAGMGLAVTLTIAACGSSGSGDSTTSGGSGNSCAVAGAAPSGDNSGAEIKPSDHFSSPPPASLIEAAKKEGGGFVWYEGDSPQQNEPVLKAFAAKYPFVTHATEVQLLSSQIGPRIVQEEQAGAATADLASSDPATIQGLIDRKLVKRVPYCDAGIPASLVVNDNMVETVAGITVFLRNTKLVSDAEAPQTWDDLLDPKWKGKVGTWVTPYPYAELVSTWGPDKATEYAKKTQANKPVFFQTGFLESQAIASGQIPLGVTYASTVPNSPDVAVTVPDPVPVSFLFSFIPKSAQHPATAQLFLNWLTTAEGDAIYQQHNFRGNPLLPNTATEALVKGKTIAAFPVGKSNELATWLNNFSQILK